MSVNKVFSIKLITDAGETIARPDEVAAVAPDAEFAAALRYAQEALREGTSAPLNFRVTRLGNRPEGTRLEWHDEDGSESTWFRAAPKSFG